MPNKANSFPEGVLAQRLHPVNQALDVNSARVSVL